MSSSLLAIPNISEGSRHDVISAVRAAYEGAGATVLDESSDPDHGRTVHTLTGSPAELAAALTAGWRVCNGDIDLRASQGVHPHVGVMDVAPIVFNSPEARGLAVASALASAGSLGRVGASVFLYGLLAGGRTRAELRSGGLSGLRDRAESGMPLADFGPKVPSVSAGAVLVAARPPLIAFNLRLASPTSLDEAQATAAAIRDGGISGIAGLRALAFKLNEQGFVQLSFNLEDPDAAGLAVVVAAVRDRHEVVSGELIGLTLRRYIDQIPSDLTMPDFDPDLKSVEGCLRFHGIVE